MGTYQLLASDVFQRLLCGNASNVKKKVFGPRTSALTPPPSPEPAWRARQLYFLHSPFLFSRHSAADQMGSVPITCQRNAPPLPSISAHSPPSPQPPNPQPHLPQSLHIFNPDLLCFWGNQSEGVAGCVCGADTLLTYLFHNDEAHHCI